MDGLVQNGDALRIFEFASQTTLLDSAFNNKWLLILATLWIVIFFLFFLTGFYRENSFLVRLRNSLRGRPVKELFYKFSFATEAPASQSPQIMTGYLRFLGYDKARFLAEKPLHKGSVITIDLNSLPGFTGGEVKLAATVKACVLTSRRGKDYTVEVSFLKPPPAVRAKLDEYLNSFHPAEAEPLSKRA